MSLLVTSPHFRNGDFWGREERRQSTGGQLAKVRKIVVSSPFWASEQRVGEAATVFAALWMMAVPMMGANIADCRSPEWQA